MSATQEEALGALSATCQEIYSRALANLAALRVKRSLFSNPYKKVRAYSLEEIARSLEIGAGDDGSFTLLASLDGTKVNFIMHERLMRLANHIVTCNLLQDTVDRTMKVPALAQLLVLGTQSIAILASLIGKFAAFSAAYNHTLKKGMKSDGAAGVDAETNEALARKYSDDFGSDIKGLSKLLVDHKHARELIMSLSLPYPPVILSHRKHPDGRILNGVWMTADMERQWKEYLAQEQATARRHVGDGP
jgi:hypothetical protein